MLKPCIRRNNNNIISDYQRWRSWVDLVLHQHLNLWRSIRRRTTWLPLIEIRVGVEIVPLLTIFDVWNPRAEVLNEMLSEHDNVLSWDIFSRWLIFHQKMTQLILWRKLEMASYQPISFTMECLEARSDLYKCSHRTLFLITCILTSRRSSSISPKLEHKEGIRP